MIYDGLTCINCVYCDISLHRKSYESSMAYCTKDKNKWVLIGRYNTPCNDFKRKTQTFMGKQIPV